MVGTLTLYMGCMYSGKTSILIRGSIDGKVSIKNISD